MQYTQFARRVIESGLVPKDCGNGHYRIEGGKYTVNWWPFSAKRTIYVDGLNSKTDQPHGDIEKAIDLAWSDPDIKSKEQKVRRKSPATFRKIKQRLLKNHPYCRWCDVWLDKNSATLDHVIPLARGGSNGTNNLVLSCEPCNREKGDGAPVATGKSAPHIPTIKIRQRTEGTPGGDRELLPGTEPGVVTGGPQPGVPASGGIIPGATVSRRLEPGFGPLAKYPPPAVPTGLQSPDPAAKQKRADNWAGRPYKPRDPDVSP